MLHVLHPGTRYSSDVALEKSPDIPVEDLTSELKLHHEQKRTDSGSQLVNFAEQVGRRGGSSCRVRRQPTPVSTNILAQVRMANWRNFTWRGWLHVGTWVLLLQPRDRVLPFSAAAGLHRRSDGPREPRLRFVLPRRPGARREGPLLCRGHSAMAKQRCSCRGLPGRAAPIL